MDELKFIQVGELAKGISENLLPDSDFLSGRTLQLFFENGAVTRFRFDSPHRLSWEVLEGAEKGTRVEETYRAIAIRDHICLVDFISQTRRATSVNLVIDLKTNAATQVVGILPAAAEVKKDIFSRADEGLPLTAVRCHFQRAAVDRSFTPEMPCHRQTSEMIGQRFQYIYSQTETYEHIYLNENLYTWHCLSGIEKGLADTDRCHYYKIEDKLYLFVWCEKIIPTLGVVLLDWRQMKTAGKLFGYESNDFGKLSNTAIGAYAARLNVTRYPESFPPQQGPEPLKDYP